MNATAPDAAVLARAADVLRGGGAIIFPTDTFYGLAADPRRADAVARVFAAKGRPSGVPLPLVASSLEQAEREVAFLSGTASRLARRFWPGPLALLAAPRLPLVGGVAGGDGSVALRVPDHAVARALAAALGFAITATSANASGRPSLRTAEEAARELEGRVDLVLDSGPTPGGLPSTIVDARVDPPLLVRNGAVPFQVILDAVSHP